LELRELALGYPEAYEEFPWGERALKVKGKVFVFMSLHEGVLRVTVKLPQTAESALALPFVSPTGYGLGKSGWVTAAFSPGDDVPIDTLMKWVDESFRAVAPKRIVAKWDNTGCEETKRKPKRARGKPTN
jgi:predicted DNA-binding protein (MmcQ/YjbR family)